MQGHKVSELEVKRLARNGGIGRESVHPKLATQSTSLSTRGEDHKAISDPGARGRAGLLHTKKADTELTHLLADKSRPASHERRAGRISAKGADVEGGKVEAGKNNPQTTVR